MEVPVALAFTAGLVATVNPCGFAMLPAYLSFFLGLDDGEAARPTSTAVSVLRGLRVGAAVSVGFLAVFALAGVLLTLGTQLVAEVVPWAAMVVGVGVAGLGIAMLAGYAPTASLPKLGRGTDAGGVGGVVLFGVSYAIASLSCTLPVFLAVVASTMTQAGLLSGVLTFLVYGLGMSVLLLVVTMALALGKRAVIGWLRRASRHVNRVSGLVLVLAGTSIVVFWAATLSGAGLPRAIVWLEQTSARATNLLADAGGWLGVAGFALVVGAGLAARTVLRRHADTTGERAEREASPPTAR